MSRPRALAYALAACLTAGAASGDAPSAAVLGTVSSAARPVANALIIALNLADFGATETYTAVDGSFSLTSLRSGIYKLIAVKQGFAPAITTIVRTNKPQRVSLRLESERTAARRGSSQEIWELRGSLPADILRDIDMVLAANSVELDVPRLRGEVRSLAGVEARSSDRSFAQTSLGFEGRLNEKWQLGLSGNLQRFDQAEALVLDEPLAESSGMRVELRSSPTDGYKIATTRSSWLYDGAGIDRQADVQAHNFEWQRGDARVQVRYLEQENLFTGVAGPSNLIEVAGDTTILQTPRNDLGVAIRLRQESVASNDVQFRTAELSANGTVSLVPSVVLQYGMASNVGLEGQELAPRTGVQWKVGHATSLVASVLYKAVDRHTSPYAIPSIVFWSEEGRSLPRYAYSLGFVSGPDEANRVSALFTVTAVDTPLRVVFTDGYDQFWDGLHVAAGDVRRDVRLAYRRQFGNRFAIDLATSAGTATSQVSIVDGQKTYVTGDLQSTFTPTGTTVIVSYRDIQQPRENGSLAYRTERIHLRMAQSLYLPFDLKLLLGVELARAENSPYLIDSIDAEGSRKYVGGLAVNF